MAEVTAQLSLDIAKLKAGLEQARIEMKRFKADIKGDSASPLGSFNGSDGQFTSIGKAAGGNIAGGMSTGMLASAGLVTAAAMEVMHGVEEVAMLGAEGVARAIEHGLKFNYDVDTVKASVASVVEQYQGLGHDDAKGVGDQADAYLKQKALTTASTYKDMSQGLMATVAAAQQVGVSLKQNIDLVSAYSNAANKRGMTPDMDRIRQELGNTLEGNIGARLTHISHGLGITKEDIELHTQMGDVAEFLLGKLGKLGEANDSAAVTFTNLIDRVDAALGAMTKPLFDQMIKGAAELSKYLEAPGFAEHVTEIARQLDSMGSRIIKMGPELSMLASGFLNITETAISAGGGVMSLIKDLENLAASPGARILMGLGSGGFTEVVRAFPLEAATPALPAATPGELQKARDEYELRKMTTSKHGLDEKPVVVSTKKTETQIKAEKERETQLKAIESLHEKIHKLTLGELSPAERLAELERDRAKNYEGKNKTGGLNFENSSSGLNKWAEALHKFGNFEKEKEVLGLLEKELEIQKEQESITKKMSDEKARAAEDLEKKLHQARKKTDDDELKVMSPKQQFAKLRQELAYSFGLKIVTKEDVAHGLKADKEAISKAEKSHDKEGELKAREKYNRDLETTSKLIGTLRHAGHHAGETAGAIGLLTGRSGHEVVRDEVRKTNELLGKLINLQSAESDNDLDLY